MNGVVSTFVTVLLVAVLVAVAVAIVRFNIKRRYIAECFARATEQEVEAIFQLIELSSEVPPTACVLCRSKRRGADKTNIITIPSWLASFPWAGRAASIGGDGAVNLREDGSDGSSQLAGHFLRPLRVPKVQTKSGKARNVYSPKRYIALSPELTDHLSRMCERYPAEMLTYLLCPINESFEYEPLEQIRIAGSPEWAQMAQFPRCRVCAKPLMFIFQFPGMLTAVRNLREATFYVFGCSRHTDEYETVTQFT
jgi:hypothetical protein